jgi:2,3-dihydro-2,3-dihydroxybenzoate dehydrogenase
MARPDPPAVTLVTGAASGIGAAVARAIVANGGVVAALDRDERALTALARELGPKLADYVADVTDPALISQTVSRVESELGPIHALVNAAGVLPLGELSCAGAPELAEFRRAFAVNVEATWLVSHAVAQHMKRRRCGAMVTVSSNAGSTPRLGMGLYCATKAASTMLTRCLALELARYGIRCNVVSPGSTATPMLERLLDSDGLQRVIVGDLQAHRLGIPLGRVAQASDIADSILFLLSERARHITLHDLRIDGGATL